MKTLCHLNFSNLLVISGIILSVILKPPLNGPKRDFREVAQLLSGAGETFLTFYTC